MNSLRNLGFRAFYFCNSSTAATATRTMMPMTLQKSTLFAFTAKQSRGILTARSSSPASTTNLSKSILYNPGRFLIQKQNLRFASMTPYKPKSRDSSAPVFLPFDQQAYRSLIKYVLTWALSLSMFLMMTGILAYSYWWYAQWEAYRLAHQPAPGTKQHPLEGSFTDRALMDKWLEQFEDPVQKKLEEWKWVRQTPVSLVEESKDESDSTQQSPV